MTMSESEFWHPFTSLPEFLKTISGKPLDEAKQAMQAEYAAVSRLIEEARRARRSGDPVRMNPAMSEYFSDLLCLVNGIDGQPVDLNSASEGSRKYIESALKYWHPNK
jgi:hypothetical protein